MVKKVKYRVQYTYVYLLNGVELGKLVCMWGLITFQWSLFCDLTLIYTDKWEFMRLVEKIFSNQGYNWDKEA